MHRRRRVGGHGRIFGIIDAKLLVEQIVGVLLLDVGHDLHDPIVVIARGLVRDRSGRVDRAGRINAVGHLVIVDGEADLREIVGAARAAGRLAGRLHGRQQQGDEHANDGDHHEQLD